jgi:hypothetical protein
MMGLDRPDTPGEQAANTVGRIASGVGVPLGGAAANAGKMERLARMLLGGSGATTKGASQAASRTNAQGQRLLPQPKGRPSTIDEVANEMSARAETAANPPIQRDPLVNRPLPALPQRGTTRTPMSPNSVGFNRPNVGGSDANLAPALEDVPLPSRAETQRPVNFMDEVRKAASGPARSSQPITQGGATVQSATHKGGGWYDVVFQRSDGTTFTKTVQGKAAARKLGANL